MFGFVAAYPNEAEQGGKGVVVPYNVVLNPGHREGSAIMTTQNTSSKQAWRAASFI